MPRPRRMHAPRPHLGKQLRALRENWGWTEKELSLALGCSRSLVVKYEGRFTGQKDVVPPVSYLHRINILKRALRNGLKKEEILVGDGYGRHVVTTGLVARNNAGLRFCRRQRCEVPFVPVVPVQIFCGSNCRKSHYRKR